MTGSNTVKRYCPECRKSISQFAHKCPYCTADVSNTSEDTIIIEGFAASIVFWREILVGAIVAITTYFIANVFVQQNKAIIIASIAFLILWIPLGIRRYRIYNKQLDEMFKKKED